MNDFKAQVEHLETVWKLMFPDVQAPNAAHWSMWLCRYDPHLIQMVLARLQRRYDKTPWDFPTPINLYKFASSMMRTQAAQHCTPVMNTGVQPREENFTHV